ncbi:hypothetical protein N9Z54_08390 [Planctomycetota bacterium]|nr:hypothetical protein [Planctomycetota bacterium]
MKQLPLLAAPLALLSACGLHIEVEGTSEAAEPVAAVVRPSFAVEAGQWKAEQVFEEGDSNMEAVVTVDGRRSGTWRLQFGEGIESITYGFIGIGGRSRTSTTKLLGRTELDLTMELEDIDAEELLKALETLGADEAKSIELEASLRATDGVKATLTASSNSGSATTAGMLPGATRDAAVWPASSRQAIGSVVADQGEVKVLASEHWGEADGSRTSLQVRRAAGRVDANRFEVSYKLDGERQTFNESSTPAWVLFVVAD